MQIPKRALDAQRKAAHPAASVWVSANAGSGKTHVLTERVIRLMLNGSEPSRILCLTYTKAAAAVMKTRIFDRLSRWTALDDKQLCDEIEALEGKRPDQSRLLEARRLFAHALETPGGLKIQTIHAFCESLLHQFPLEANIAGHFEMLDEMAASALMGDARRTLIEKAYKKADPALSNAFNLVLTTVGENGFNTLLSEAINKRETLLPFLAEVKDKGSYAVLRPLLGLKTETEEDVLVALREAALLPQEESQLFETHGGSNTAEFIMNLREAKKSTQPSDMERAIRAAYLTTAGAPRGLSRIVTKKLSLAAPLAMEELEKRQSAVVAALDQLSSLRLLPLNDAAFTLIEGLLTRYEALKRVKGFLDFDDLIHRTLALLQRKGAGQWVQYKLDRGIDHILVDEAQDTSPAQWGIIRKLIEEFFVGLGQRSVKRTVFAVGDEKQSIYSFQGAAPEDFAENGRYVKNKAEDVEESFDRVRLDFSFRSTKEVLSGVDIVFSTPENYRGLSAENEKTVHEAIRHDPGEVDIWDMITPENVDEPEDWRAPVDAQSAPAVQLAELIAETVANWLKENEPIFDHGFLRAVKPGDIIVLVRKRDQFVPALARALKNRHVAVAGADRLHLTNHIAVRDLIALGRFILQPQDDLSLACLFKTPLYALNEDDLFELAAYRQGSLWQALEKRAKTDTRFHEIYETLSRYRRMADTVPVFELYSTILSDDGGRRKILARLGAEAADVLDAFMDYCLSVQKTGLPGLQTFLETLVAATPEIKRELDQNREEVRIMTVHAAKGLEGKIVFLVDPGSRIWNAHHEPKLLILPYHNAPHNVGEAVLWVPGKNYKGALIHKQIDILKARAEDEYRRLLYVGMTRAEDRLIVCGYSGKTKVEGTWNSLVKDALYAHAEAILAPKEGINAWRYSLQERTLKTPEIQPPVAKKTLALPPFLLQKMPPERALPKPLSPSLAGLEIDDEEVLTLTQSPILGMSEKGIGSPRDVAIKRGILMHKLIQYLPDIPPLERKEIVKAYLEKNAPDFNEETREKIEKDLSKFFEHPQIASLFHAHSQAELAIQGKVMLAGKEQTISGQIDRLIVDNDRVLIVDFKTGIVPHKDTVPQAYVIQMALYRALLQPLYPGKTIETVLIYTEGPTVFFLSDECLDDALKAIENTA